MTDHEPNTLLGVTGPPAILCAVLGCNEPAENARYIEVEFDDGAIPTTDAGDPYRLRAQLCPYHHQQIGTPDDRYTMGGP